MKENIFFALCFTSLFQTVNAQLADPVCKKLDSIFADYNKTNSPGCALAILKDGKIIYEKEYKLLNCGFSKASFYLERF